MAANERVIGTLVLAWLPPLLCDQGASDGKGHPQPRQRQGEVGQRSLLRGSGRTAQACGGRGPNRPSLAARPWRGFAKRGHVKVGQRMPSCKTPFAEPGFSWLRPSVLPAVTASRELPPALPALLPTPRVISQATAPGGTLDLRKKWRPGENLSDCSHKGARGRAPRPPSFAF